MDKIFQIKDRPNSLKLTEDELISAIKNGLLKADDVIICNKLDEEVMIKDSIYAFYLDGDSDE